LELNRLETTAVVSEGRKSEVAVEIGVAMAWKMLATRQDTSDVKPGCEAKRVFDDGFRRSAEGAIANDWVVGVGVDVEYGCEIQIDSERAQLSAEDACRLSCQR
jgi:hypothetical protein